MRVLMATPGGRRGKGGMTSLVNYLVDALPARLPGVGVDVVDTYGPGRFWLMPLYFAGGVVQVIAARLGGQVDLLHIHMAHYGSAVRKLLLALVATLLGVRTVMHMHGSDFHVYYRALPRWYRRALVAVLRRCERVVVIGEFWRGFVVEELGLDPRRVVLIHNGVPRPDAPRGPPAAGAAPKLLMLGELGPRKGTPELIAALATPALRARAWTATLAGNGLVEQYRAEVAALGLADRIALPGWQSGPQVRALLAASDLFVLPSRLEGLPVAILEAMAGGVAVIATPVGAIGDAIVDGETGLLVPPGDVAALGAAIGRLIDDAALRARLAANACARFEAMFTIDRTADAVAALYRAIGVA
ncbi:MAG: glycosyltransferase family 4 protein [Alphaproteobacteria bacterium]|nr:glycosyltransferase family 4 protein [Alphaproteobacteria bacterium]